MVENIVEIVEWIRPLSCKSFAWKTAILPLKTGFWIFVHAYARVM